MSETVESLTLLQQLEATQKDKLDALAEMINARDEVRTEFEQRANAEAEDAQPTAEQRQTHAAEEEQHEKELDRREAELDHLATRIKEQEVLELRRQTAAKASQGTVSVTSEPLTYRKDNAQKQSYFRDLACVQVPAIASRMDDPEGAVERLSRHAAEMNVEMPKRHADRERKAHQQADEAERRFTSSVAGMHPRGLSESPFERRTNPNRTDGQGGYFVPPIWLIDDYIPYLRAGRVAAGLCRQMTLPEGTDSINIPKVLAGSAASVQTDGGTVSSSDITDTSVSAGVKTIAGQQDIALQLLEQSPGQIFDQVVIQDLTADYNLKLNQQVISGAGGSGQFVGIYPPSGWTAGSVGSASVSTGQLTNQILGAMASRVATNRYDLSNFAYLVHPRRWFWYATALDGASGTSGRPIVNPNGSAYNIDALNVGGDTPAQGLVGHTSFGFPVYIDASVPTNESSTRDVVFGNKWDDLWLFEGSLRTRVLPEVLSGTLQVRIQIYNYAAFLVRYGSSICQGWGGAFAAPTAALDSTVTF